MRIENVYPRHIAIIMDGNGRWAKQRGLPRAAGHRAGAETVRKIVEYCAKQQIDALTLFAFSTENWKRPKSEIAFLMNLFVTYLQKEVVEFNRNNIRFRAIGDRDALATKVRKKIELVEMQTANNTGLHLVIAVNYSGRWDIANAARKLGNEVAEGKLMAQDISIASIQEKICLADLPEPDLFIRTSGEIRLSNFLLWQLAYTELYFTEVHWPDFSVAELEHAIETFRKRERRFGGLIC